MNKKCKYLKQKVNREIWCIYNEERVFKNMCSKCNVENRYDSAKKCKILHTKKHKLTKATDIPKSIKLIVWERDNHRCIFCKKEVPWNYANSHYIKRSQLGLGIEENIMTNCDRCHTLFEESIYRERMKVFAKNYLMNKYNVWNEGMLIYRKHK